MHAHTRTRARTHTHTLKRSARISAYPASTAVAQALHRHVDVGLKYFTEFSAVAVHPGCLAVVRPGIVKHQVHVIAKLTAQQKNPSQKGAKTIQFFYTVLLVKHNASVLQRWQSSNIPPIHCDIHHQQVCS